MATLTAAPFQTGNDVSNPPPAWGAVYALALCTFTLIASEFMPISLLSPIAQTLDLTEGQAGQAIAVSGAFAVLTSLFITRIAGGFDRRNVLLAMTALLIVSGVLVAFAPDFKVLMLGRVHRHLRASLPHRPTGLSAAHAPPSSVPNLRVAAHATTSGNRTPRMAPARTPNHCRRCKSRPTSRRRRAPRPARSRARPRRH